MTLSQQIQSTPAMARALPFGIFLMLTFLAPMLGESGKYWLYLAKTLVGVWLIWQMRPVVAEMRWNFSPAAVLVGVGICAMWVGFEYVPWRNLAAYLGFGTFRSHAVEAPTYWNPFEHFGTASPMAWFFVVVRTLGSSLVVPPLEETFYRSFLYRYTFKEDFQSVPLNRFAWWPMIFTALVFASTHGGFFIHAILCHVAYQLLVIRKNRLGDAIAAHAITNFLLSIWVVAKGDWAFW